MHDPQLHGGTAAALPASARRDRGWVRSPPSRPRGKFSSTRPGCLDSGPGLESFRAKAASWPARVADPEFKRNNYHCVTCLVGQDLAESCFRCPRLTVQGPKAAGPEDPASSGPSIPWRSSSTRSVSLLVLCPFLSVSLSACFLCLPSTPCLCTVYMGSKI